MAYIFHYQSAERVSDKDNRAIALYEYKMLNEFPDDGVRLTASFLLTWDNSCTKLIEC